jgi:hypothetical protein
MRSIGREEEAVLCQGTIPSPEFHIPKTLRGTLFLIEA